MSMEPIPVRAQAYTSEKPGQDYQDFAHTFNLERERQKKFWQDVYNSQQILAGTAQFGKGSRNPDPSKFEIRKIELPARIKTLEFLPFTDEVLVVAGTNEIVTDLSKHRDQATGILPRRLKKLTKEPAFRKTTDGDSVTQVFEELPFADIVKPPRQMSHAPHDSRSEVSMITTAMFGGGNVVLPSRLGAVSRESSPFRPALMSSASSDPAANGDSSSTSSSTLTSQKGVLVLLKRMIDLSNQRINMTVLYVGLSILLVILIGVSSYVLFHG